MPTSIRNQPTPTASGMSGGIAAAFQQARENARKEKMDTKIRQQQALTTLSEKMNGMTEDEQADYLELQLRRPDIESVYGTDAAGLQRMAIPSATLQTGRSVFSASAPGERPVHDQARAQARTATATADLTEADARTAKRVEQLQKTTGIVGLKSMFVKGEGGEKLTTAEVKSIQNDTASDELVDSLREPNDLDQQLETIRAAAPFLGMNEGVLVRKYMQARILDPLLASTLDIALKKGQVDQIPLMLEMNRVLLDKGKLELEQLGKLVKTGGPTITSEQRLKLQQGYENAPFLAAMKLNPAINAEALKTGQMQVISLNSQGDPASIPNMILPGSTPATLRGVDEDDKAFFEIDAVLAILGPNYETAKAAVSKYNLIIPSIAELGNPQAAERLLASYEQAMKFRFETIRLPGAKKGEFTTLTRPELLNFITETHALEGSLIRRLQQNRLANPIADEDRVFTGAQPRFGERPASEEPQDSSTAVFQDLLNLGETASGFGTHQRDSSIDDEIKAGREEEARRLKQGGR